MALDPFDASAHAAAAHALTYAREHEAALELGHRGVELNANFPYCHYALAVALMYGGRPLEAIPALEQGVALNPRDPELWIPYTLQCAAHYTAGQYGAAACAADQALARRPGWGGCVLVKAATLVRLGRTGEATGLLAQLPGIVFTIMPHIMPYRNVADFEHVLAALEQAGTGHKIIEDARRVFADLQFGKFR